MCVLSLTVLHVTQLRVRSPREALRWDGLKHLPEPCWRETHTWPHGAIRVIKHV